ncbi:CLUMA_CG020137, isoform A [Clunio marinus]|uniref:CLUMA_CG020137, isoform A n=1 Tax=Clunio marinus TaxID=568069 RepID=A0A1J1J6N2_9DIPT|nr:CLUMA_CG020137, isoform A [Clunio marinus]
MELPKGARITHSGLLQHNSDGTTDIQKITQAGLVARSPEGTAAKGMNIRGNEDLWVEIQANTFRNWVNEHLRDVDLQVSDLSIDFCDGTHLCALVESLQKKRLRPSWNKHPANQHHFLENATKALKAIEDDGIKLVNIGNVDIINGNLKLILGLIWSLIVRYQIGRSKFPPRKLMLAWLQAAFPECKVSNLTTDWNSGVLLSALLDYCEPGLFPHWKSLDPNQSVRNCETAMNIAHRNFRVPKILEPEYLASPWLDELSGMTYLSYFMKPDGPGYNTSMRWVNSQIKVPVNNFTSDWNNGKVFCEIIKGLGGAVPNQGKISSDPAMWESNMKRAMESGKRFGINPVLSPKDMTQPDVEHLAIMAYATHLQWVTPRPPLADMIAVHLQSTSGRVAELTHFRVETLSRDIDPSNMKVYVVAPHDKGVATLVKLNHRGEGTFVPDIYGMHEILVEIGSDRLGGHFFRVLPRLVQVTPPGMAPCALGSLVEVLVNATGAPRTEDILVTAYAPSGHEAGIWEIAITYQGKHIQGGPYTCAVFDPSGVSVHGIDGAMPFKAHVFEIDARGVGVNGELHVDIVNEKKSVVCAVEKLVENKYRVTFMPRQNGKHRVYVYFNGHDVKGSPFIMRVGTKGRSGKTRSSSSHDSTRNRSESPSLHFNSSYLKTADSPIKRELYSPQNIYKSYSPQLSPAFDDRHDIKTSRELYSSPRLVSPTRFGSPGRDLYSPKLVDEQQHGQSTHFKNSVRNDIKKSQSPEVENIYSRKSVSKTNFLSDENINTSSYISKFKTEKSYGQYDSPILMSSPINMRSSPIIHSPLTVNASEEIRRSPRISTSYLSPYDNSSMKYISGTQNLLNSSINSNSEVYKVSQHSYKSMINNSVNSKTDASGNIDYFPITSPVNTQTASRRDSWDVLNKTKHMFSENSLESLNNIADKQLDSYLTYDRSTIEDETNSNTQHNKFLQSSLSYKDKRSNFVSIADGINGAKAIRVSNKPDGFLGQPFEFEIDGSKAGSGNLEILVNGGRVTSSVRSLGGQTFVASFTPHETGIHTVQITFNGETVPGSPWLIDIMPSSPGLTALGESTRLVPANQPAVFEILPPLGTSLTRSDFAATVLSPSKSKVVANVTNEVANGAFRIEFIPKEVGTHIIEASISGTKLVGGPLIAKVYDSSLIQVNDVNGGVVGQACQFRVDASAAGEGQLEISINEGEVPNHVQVVGGGKCLVSFTPEQPKPHIIDIKFNGETVHGCPFLCSIADTSRVSLNLSNLELIPLNIPASFLITVSGGGAAELAVSVRSPLGELPVRVTGNIHSGFTAEFTPIHVGAHTINVDYNGYPVNGTPFTAKSYDAKRVSVGSVTKGSVGRPLQFTVDAGEAGEGNLEITISAKGHNIPTQVHPQGNAKFAVSFVPAEACEHVINVSFNKMPVPGCPIHVKISGDLSGPQVSLNGPGPVHVPNSLIISQAGGRLDDIEVNVEGPTGHSIPAQVLQTSDGNFKAEFVPRIVGEHKISVMIQGQPIAGSPYSAKVYDVSAIKVKNVTNGTVGNPVTFLVETAQAGPGNLEVTVNDGRVPTSAQAQGQHTYAISFTPRDALSHTVELRFNGQDVPGSPFICNIASPARIIGIETLDKVSVDQEFDFFVQSSTQPIAEILGPARRIVPVTVEEVLLQNGFKIKFKPIDVGDHSIEVRLPPNGSHVEGSPFLLKAYSAQKVVVSDIKSGIVGKSVNFSINASQAGAGNLEIIVAVNGKNVPNFVTSEGNARFKVNFKPTDGAKHSLSVRFNGHPVPGSPFSCNILPQPVSSLKVMASGEALRQAPVNIDNVFELEGFDFIEPQVYITSPTGDNVPSKLTLRNNVWFATFRPKIVGRHLISVSIGEQHIAGSPFNCNIFDVSRVSISGLNHSSPSPIGIPITFNVDAAGAGEGTLELVVSTANNTVKAEVTACARGLYDVTFIPQNAEPHFVNITFNDIPIHGNPFKCDVQQNIQNIQVGSPMIIDLIDNDYILEVLGPNRKIIPYTTVGKRKAEFKTLEIGTYTIKFSDRETKTIVSTRNVNVFNATMVKVVEVGQAICNRPATIVVSLSESGTGTLSAIVKCGSLEVPYSIRQSKNSLWEIVYHPTRIAPHKVAIMFNGTPIAMKPIEIVILPPSTGKDICVHGLGLYQARVGKTTSFAIDTNGRSASEFDVVVEQLSNNNSGTGGQALPVRCYQTKSGHLQAEFTVQKSGRCKIDVLHQSKPLTGSPFICECYDPTKVRLMNITKSNLVINQAISFSLNTKEAGNADVDISVLSPNGQNIPVTIMHKEEEEFIEFMPLLSGHYKCFILYGGEQVKTPITFAVSSLSIKSEIRAIGTGLEVAQRGKESSFKIFSPSSPIVQIENIMEQGKQIESRIKSLSNNEWQIFYTVMSVGSYEIRASCPNRGPLPGSPWIISCVDSTKVTPSNGWSSYLDDEGRLILPANVKLNTTDAGPGELLCVIDGNELNIAKGNGENQETHIPADGLSFGEHTFELLWSGMSIGQCPVKAYVISQQAADKVKLSGHGLSVAQVGEVSHFVIDASKVGSYGGLPEATLSYPDNLSIPVNIQEKNLEKGIWLASYSPPKASQAPLHLNVKWCGKLIKGSPFNVVIGSSVDSSKVKCSGEGLRHGVVGQQIKSWIDTRRAGPGELTAHCSGPRKVAYCELYDHGDATFTLNIKPQEPGRHALTIKYGGQHVPGSPFSLRVVGAPDASKVRVYGPGIEHGVLATFQSRFICDTRGAGAGQLTVRVRGPKGAFRVEMQRESQKDRTILCKYDPTEPGDYRVEVKWANELVPGSPFPVMIFDTQEELRRFLSVTP